jgi:hypothetical protein
MGQAAKCATIWHAFVSSIFPFPSLGDYRNQMDRFPDTGTAPPLLMFAFNGDEGCRLSLPNVAE